MTIRIPDVVLDVVEYDAFTRLDFWVFVSRVFAELTGEQLQDNWHIQLLCAEVDRIRTQPNTKLAIALPPRSLKSIIVSVALPAWLLGHDPGIQIVCASYGHELADQLSTDCRRVMLTPWYDRLFPATCLDRQTIGHLATTTGGKRYATSVGGSLTGMGADIIIVDDPMKPDEAFSDAERNKANDWARHTLFTRLNDKADARIIMVQQRLHEDDMIGHVQEKAGFELLSFPAIAQDDEYHIIRTPFGTLTHSRKPGEALHPERESLAVLEQQRVMLGSDYFAAQYLQSPIPPGGGLVKIAEFIRFDLAGSATPGKMGGHKPRKLLGEHRDWLLERTKTDFTLRGLRDELAERGVLVDYRTVWSFAHDEGLSFKKKACFQPNNCDPKSPDDASSGRNIKAGLISSDSYSSTRPGRKPIWHRCVAGLPKDGASMPKCLMVIGKQ